MQENVGIKIDKLLEEAEYGLFSGRSKKVANVLDKVPFGLGKNAAMGIKQNRLNLAKEKRALRRTTSGNKLGNIAAYAASDKTPKELKASNYYTTRPNDIAIRYAAWNHPRAKSLFKRGNFDAKEIHDMMQDQKSEFGPVGNQPNSTIGTKFKNLNYARQTMDTLGHVKRGLGSVQNLANKIGESFTLPPSIYKNFRR